MVLMYSYCIILSNDIFIYDGYGEYNKKDEPLRLTKGFLEQILYEYPFYFLWATFLYRLILSQMMTSVELH